MGARRTMTNRLSSPLASQLALDMQAVRTKTQEIFNCINPEAYYKRPIPLRHPIVFYDGHLDAFIWNTLFRNVLNEPAFNPDFDKLFERGIDPKDIGLAQLQGISQWPSQAEIQQYKSQVNKRLYEVLEALDFSQAAHPLLKNGYVFYLLIEHELMHQETLLYIIHQLDHSEKCRPEGVLCPSQAPAPEPHMVDIPDGITRLGSQENEFPFGWDNEFPAMTTQVPAFSIDAYNVTNGQFLEFIEAGGYYRTEFWTDETWAWKSEQQKEHPFFWKKAGSEWLYKDFFADIPLPLSWPVYVTHAEASAYARFAGKSLPTEAQWHRAAFGDHLEHQYPWGNEKPMITHGNFGFQYWSPTQVGSFPKGASCYGVYDLLGNGWEWTSTVFSPFPGFQPSKAYPLYSTDFFDGQHFVIKGGSCFTDVRLLRRGFRNWFYWHYPYMYATFRCVSNH